MDYTTQPLFFKLKKALRYVRLYGVRRTQIKIASQYHMNKKYQQLPAVKSIRSARAHVGIIGCGNFAYGNIAFYLNKSFGRVIHAAMDRHVERAASMFEKYRLNYYTDNADKLISDPAIDLIFIASNHASHADYAIKALELGKHVHIEKPHVVTEDQLTRLCLAMSKSNGKVNLGFNRPYSRIGREIKRYLDAQSGATMYNWFIAGHELPANHWYFKEEEGGRVLGNLCHWTDFVYQMMSRESRYPIKIIPTRSEKSNSDIAVTYIFGDGSIAAITFSAKGHTFEGVRERFAAHRGNALISMDDFKHLVVEIVDKKHVISVPYRAHGHEEAIRRSYRMARPNGESNPGCDISYVWGTGQLFLKTKEALDKNEPISVEAYEKTVVEHDILERVRKSEIPITFPV
jgi:predicted dehydrogenase